MIVVVVPHSGQKKKNRETKCGITEVSNTSFDPIRGRLLPAAAAAHALGVRIKMALLSVSHLLRIVK